MSKRLSLGIIGLNKGNGHPYSWSAICNGYDAEAMADCPYPVIPAYLSERRFPEDAIPDANVTHIWTQDRQISEHVAKAGLIRDVVDDYRDMIGAVDAVLLARDDPECHAEIAAPFIAAGLPVLLDKMAAPTREETVAIFDSQKFPGQVQAGSALRHAAEFRLDEAQRRSLGTIRQVHGTVMKDWGRYGVHVVEPALNAIGLQGRIVECEAWHRDGLANVSLVWESGMLGTFRAVGADHSPITLTFIGTDSAVHAVFEDTFRCFKSALVRFVEDVRNGTLADDRAMTLAVVDTIDAGKR